MKTGITIALALIIAIAGPPRLIGIGCSAYPLTAGVQLAREESDFRETCRRIIPLTASWVEFQ